jgi:hypothetical protein
MKVIPKDPRARARMMTENDLQIVIDSQVGELASACRVERERRADRRRFLQHDVVAWAALVLSLVALWRSW